MLAHPGQKADYAPALCQSTRVFSPALRDRKYSTSTKSNKFFIDIRTSTLVSANLLNFLIAAMVSIMVDVVTKCQISPHAV